MKAKTIDKHLCEVMGEWVETLPEDIREPVRENIIVTGGCIASMFLQEPVNDYDVYIADLGVSGRLAMYLCETFNTLSSGDSGVPKDIAKIQFSEAKNCYCVRTWDAGFITADTSGHFPKPEDRPKFTPVFMSEHAITLTDKIQVVLRFTGAPEEIHENYDFQHAKNYWTFGTGLVTNTRSLECILARELVYTGSRYPLASIFRTRKFIKRNWNLHIGNYILMAMQLNDLDLTDMDTLRDQLTGVDALYMREIMDEVQNAKDNGTEVDSSFVQKVVEKAMGEDDTDG